MVLVVLGVIPFAMLRAKLTDVNDPDAFWHILSGQHVWRTHTVAGPDPFGHFSTNEWIQLDWLSDLWMAGAYAIGGLAAVAWVYTGLTIAVFVAMYLACRQRAGTLVSGLVAMLGWVGTSASLAFRPQTVSFILLAVTLWAWHRSREDLAPRWWLVPMTWVWACSHGFWFLGPLIGLAVICGMLLDRDADRRSVSRLLLVPLGSLVAATLTPVGLRLLALPFTVNSYASLVSEYAPPDIHTPSVAATVALLVAAAVGWARSDERIGYVDVLLWLMALALALLYTRTVALAAIIAAPIAAAQLHRVLRRAVEPVGRWELGILLGSAAAALALGAALAPHVADRPGRVPTALASAIDDLPDETVVLNDDGLGGWLLLEHPHVWPVVDTRTYLFTYDYLSRYKDARVQRGDWRSFVSSTGARAALLRKGEPLTNALGESPDWRLRAQDDEFVLLVRTGPG